jgi:hypothetical protein
MRKPMTVNPEPRYDVVSPLGGRRETALTASRALRELDGKRIAFVWDYLFRGDDVFALAKERFAADYDDVQFVDYEVFGNIHDYDELLEEMPGKLKDLDVDAAVIATGA